MAVFNTTYNYNQGNMNLLQSVLYGAFGSMTGGMGGCYGGGYGMGYGGMSMCGSLFTMPGIGCCGISDQMVGVQIGSIVSSTISNCIAAAAEGRGAKQKAASDAQDKVDALIEEIDDLNSKNTEDYIKENLDEKFDKNITEAQSNLYALTTRASAIPAEKDAKLREYNAMPDGTDAEKKAKEQFKKDNIDKLDAELKKLNETDIPAAKKKVEEAEDAKKKEIERIQKENQAKIDAKNKELTKAREELEKVVSDQVKLSSKCDTDDEYESIVGKGAEKTCDADNVKDFAKAFNYKFSQYCKTSSKDDKLAMAKEALVVYEKINRCSSKYITSDMQRNMKIMEAYVKNGGKQSIEA